MNRKTVSFLIDGTTGTVLVKAPKRLSKQDIDQMIQQNEALILSKIEKVRKQSADAAMEGILSYDDMRALAEKAIPIFAERTAYYAALIGVTYGRITVRNQRSKWGSCTSTGNLNFNCLLLLAPPEVLDSVVVHELCHRKFMNHSPEFYKEVLRIFPDYHHCNKWLKEHGPVLMKRMTLN